MTDDAARHDRPIRLLTLQRMVAVCAALLIAITTSSSAQTPPSSQEDPATRAFNLGQYDEVATLLGPKTDAASVVLRARADIARGRYAGAEKLLTPLATSSPGSDAALELGLLQLYLGRRQDGQRTLQGVLNRSDDDDADDLLRLAEASRALGEFRQANDYYREASRQSPGNAEVETGWGELFVEKYDPANAMQSFQAALKANQSYAPALLGMARATVDNNPAASKQLAEKALAINNNYVPAHLLVAELALDERNRDEAKAAITRALAVNPNSLEARSLEAAIAVLEDRKADFETAAAGVLTINPAYGEIYRIAGDHLGRNYRFDEAVVLTQRAIQLDGRNARAYANLGSHLLRTGDEPGARRALETAFKADPFDILTFNLLAMMDKLDKFETIRAGDLVVRLAPEESAVMRELVPQLAQQALDALSTRYQFSPVGPILVEMFPVHDDFAVRTIGLPGFIGALGACFGRVVTLDSPRARPPGQFNWQTTLWHEMAHVITLQMSNNRLPRWLSEGISMYEERRARPEWGRETELSYAQALEAGRLLKLRDLNDGFSDPRLINLTYYQASLVVEHLIDTYGEPALHRFIRAYGEGMETDQAITAAFNTSIDTIQTAFDAKMEKDYAALRRALRDVKIEANPTLDQLKTLAESNPDSFKVQMELAQAQHEAGDLDGAIATLERAATLVPGATGQENPHALIALIASEKKDTQRAIQALEEVIKADSTDVESARRLAALLAAQKADAAKVAAAHTRVAELDPFDANASTFVGRHAMQQKNTALAIQSFKVALAAGAADKAGAHIDLAEAHFAAGQLGDAKREALAALEIAPTFERAQDLLLKLVSAPGGAQ
ncbi:MAG: tetratricopeptide repeat protein [Acidimicrobiia bacterium]|nr:tetratricopeptide repeat protein [Acidimicrobiia bacterium]